MQAVAAAEIPAGSRHHQRTKSSVLRSFLGHKRTNSTGSALPSTPSTIADLSGNTPLAGPKDSMLQLNGAYELRRQPQVLEELYQNIRDPLARPPKNFLDPGARSPTKSSFPTFKKLADREFPKFAKSQDGSPKKPKKTKSATNLRGLLSRPRSYRNLKQGEEDTTTDKENQTPSESLADGGLYMPPIWAQFAKDPFGCDPVRETRDPALRPPAGSSSSTFMTKSRPKSIQMPLKRSDPSETGQLGPVTADGIQDRQSWATGSKQTRPLLGGVFSSMERSKSSSSVPTVEPPFDDKDIDKHLEAMLDRRNIPENQRYKMRNLTDTIKMEFIRQDWVEMQAKMEGSRINDSDASSAEENAKAPSDQDGSKQKKTGRGMSLTLSRTTFKVPLSPVKKKGDAPFGRHSRNRSTDSFVSNKSTTTGSGSNNGGFLAKIKGQQGPGDYVSYLEKVQKPELVEVGKLHKLRLLLRNETVTWTEDFIRHGGMKEIVALLHRIINVEWREEHEDALLHENLLCLKALCTTGLALQYLHSIHDSLFPAFLHLIFDPEKKGPSEFTTRNIITSILLTYVKCASPEARSTRARTVLGFLRDPEAKEEERPVSFVLDMRRERPYRVWCKEVVNVTKEVFWIFLHHLNVISLSSGSSARSEQHGSELANADATKLSAAGSPSQPVEEAVNPHEYMTRHFPQERPPVPAAPYVGGVEWDATNYLASHLDLMNAIIACTGPSAKERNELRAQLRISGWECCLGGSLRLCKEKFYGAVHDGLRTWVAAAHADGWNVRDVRYGPPPESRSVSPAKNAGGAGGEKKRREEAPPKLDIPKLDFNLGVAGPTKSPGERRTFEPWLS